MMGERKSATDAVWVSGHEPRGDGPAGNGSTFTA